MTTPTRQPIADLAQEQLSQSGTSTDQQARAAIYARTSSSSQKFGYSIDEQVERCWEHCQALGWTVVYVFSDEAESAANTDRPEFQDMLTKAERNHFDTVVFWKLDRFCRSLSDLVRTEEQLSDWDVALQSVTEFLDTASPVGRFNFRNLASAAELERDLTSQRVRIGMHGMAKEHRWPNDQPPLGYELADDQTLVIDEDEAQLVRQIFNMYLDHKSMPQVAQELNEMGIKTKENGEWTRWAVKQIISNEIYRGKYELGDFEEHVEDYRIVTDELFQEVTNTRYRFRHQKGEMDKDRKEMKADKILGEFKEAKE